MKYLIVFVSLVILGSGCASVHEKSEQELLFENERENMKGKTSPFDNTTSMAITNLLRCPLLNGRERPIIAVKTTKYLNSNRENVVLREEITQKLIESGKVSISSVEERETLQEEYNYSEEGYTKESHKQTKGGNYAPTHYLASYLISEPSSYNRDVEYLTLTLKLINVKTGLVDCYGIAK